MSTNIQWIPPTFYIRAGAQLDYRWRWSAWLAALPDTIDSFEINVGRFLSKEGESIESGVDIRGYIKASDAVLERTRTSANCKIVTVGSGGNRRIEVRDIILVIVPRPPEFSGA